MLFSVFFCFVRTVGKSHNWITILHSLCSFDSILDSYSIPMFHWLWCTVMHNAQCTLNWTWTTAFQIRTNKEWKTKQCTPRRRKNRRLSRNRRKKKPVEIEVEEEVLSGFRFWSCCHRFIAMVWFSGFHSNGNGNGSGMHSFRTDKRKSIGIGTYTKNTNLKFFHCFFQF